MPSRTARPDSAQRGFSILELLVSMLIAIEVLVAAAIAFDVHNHLATVQTQVTDLQQSLRVAQYDMTRLVRMAGRGGLPVELHPEATFVPGPPATGLGGFAIELRNNVDDASDRNIARGDSDSPLAVEGTDILAVRGCFASPIFQLAQGSIVYDPTDPTVAQLPVPNVSSANIRQPLEPLCEELRNVTRPAMILLSPEALSVYGIVEVTGHDCPASGAPGTTVNLQLKLDTNSPLNPVNPATGLRVYPPNMEVALGCMLEEYRYFVREVREDPADPTSELRPRLTRARFKPGTEDPYNDDDQNFALDLADGVFDLQVALGLDTDYPSTNTTTPGSFDDDSDYSNDTNDEVIYEGTVAGNDRNTDDWLFNDPDDDPDQIRYREHQFTTRVGQPVNLHFVRITTLARTSRGDRKYRAPDIDPDPGRDLVEDHDYTQAPADDFLSERNRRFRRRALTTIVEPRNLQ